jgi:membrane associated rhomboid family serine protease
MREEEKRMVNSMVLPFMLVVLMTAVRAVQSIGGFDLSFLGILPRSWEGLPGIVTSPFIHADFSHLAANAVPMFILGSALIYFYKDISIRVFLLIYLFTNLWVWIGARAAWHIGASGVVYGLASFIFISGVIRRHTGLMAVALIVAFLYGSMIWGIFPEFFPERNISWESHLFGIIAGGILAWFFRKEGPQIKVHEWPDELDEDDDDTSDDDDTYWRHTLTDEEIKDIKRTYRGRDLD